MYHAILAAFRKQYPKYGHAYYPQFRLEGRARDTNNENNLAMCTADPLWMLGRQWQFGEFVGEDNGSPVEISTHALRERITHVEFGGHQTNGVATPSIPLDDHPLEAVVEAIPHYPNDLKSEIKAGQQFLRLVREKVPGADVKAIRKALQAAHPLRGNKKLDRASQQLLQVSRVSAFAGVSMLQDRVDKDPPFAGLDQTLFTPLITAWEAYKNWFAAKYFSFAKESTPSWDRERLVHNFTVSTRGANADIRLHASDYQQGELDWYSFDKANKIEFKNEGSTKEQAQIPVRMRFPGMPQKRLFAFEDNQVNLGGMHIEEGDLLRMMLLDMALYASDDWYLIPFAMQTNEVAWIDKLEVRDIFGVNTAIDNAHFHKNESDKKDTWDVFKIRNQNRAANYKLEERFFYAAPAVAQRRESVPLEEVLFLRDEFANLVWAKEQRLTNASGDSVDGFDLHRAVYGSPLAQEEHPSEISRYRLANTVPHNWIPYVPRLPDEKHQNGYLLRASMLSHDRQVIAPLSYLIGEELKVIRTEHIPKAGLRVQLTHQRARTADGSTYLWLGRKVLAGKGEGNSGLRFDYLEE